MLVAVEHELWHASVDEREVEATHPLPGYMKQLYNISRRHDDDVQDK